MSFSSAAEHLNSVYKGRLVPKNAYSTNSSTIALIHPLDVTSFIMAEQLRGRLGDLCDQKMAAKALFRLHQSSYTIEKSSTACIHHSPTHPIDM